MAEIELRFEKKVDCDDSSVVKFSQTFCPPYHEPQFWLKREKLFIIQKR